MSNRPDYLHWQIDGIDYKFYLASKSYQWIDDRSVVADIRDFSYDIGQEVMKERRSGINSGDAIMEIDGDPFGIDHWDDDKGWA